MSRSGSNLKTGSVRRKYSVKAKKRRIKKKKGRRRKNATKVYRTVR